MVAIAIFIFIVLSFVLLWFCFKGRGQLPPLAAGALPLVGHTFTVVGNIDRLYEVIFESMLGTMLKQGIEVVTVRLGAWSLYAIMNPDDGYLLSNTCLKKDIVYTFFKPLFGDGLITAEAPIWKQHRKLISPTFNQKVLDVYLVEFNKESRQLVKDIAKEVDKGPFDQILYVKHTIFQIICATTLGISSDENDQKIFAYHKYYETFTDCMIERSRKFWYHNDFLFGLSNLKKRQYAAARTLQEFAETVLKKRREGLKAQKNSICNEDSKPRFQAFLDLLLELSEEGSLTDEEIRDEMNTLIAAGTDTSAHALCNILLLVGSYPKVQKKIFEELHTVFGGDDRDVERQDLAKLKYLEAVIKETLRLYPVVAIFGRIMDKDVKLKDYTLPAGSRCYVSVYHIGRHPQWGPDAEKFRPERWLDPASLPASPYALAVFGLGKRSCIGSNYGMMSMKTILVHLLRQYRVSGDVTKLVQRFDIVIRPASGYHICIERR